MGKTYLNVAADIPNIGKSRPAKCLGPAKRHGELVVSHKAREGR